jgi:hypothetical protein
LKQASGLSWPRFADFLEAWDLEAFSHPSLERSEAELFEALSGFSRDGSECLEVLLGRLQVRATPGQRETLRKADVLAFLRVREDHFYPVPSVFQDGESLFETRSVIELRQAIEEGDGWVVVHGPSGSGKTSALRRALTEDGREGKAVLYDCFAEGQGLLPGNERFPYAKCFTQVINELDARYRTGILATVGLDYQGLMRQLRRALETAATCAEREGHRLVVAFDAIDNAQEQERRAPKDAGESFVPILWGLAIPRNCTLVVSLRTENLPEVIADHLRDARRAEIKGFDLEETRIHVERFAAPLVAEEIIFLYERTAGNPRVQSKVLEEIATNPTRDPHRLINESARITAFEYYDGENERRLASSEIRHFLAVLYEMRQPPKLGTVAAVSALSEQKLRGILDRLSFGLRLDPGEYVAWRDQDFLDWTALRLESERDTARTELADYCLRAFEHEEYARWNLSYHFLQAERFDELVAWWNEPDRMNEQICKAHPHEERVLEDLRATIIATLRSGQTCQAFDLLLRAADIAEGRDAFADGLTEYPEIAVAANLAHMLPGGPGEDDRLSAPGRWLSDPSISVAAELARYPDRLETAERLFARFKAAKQAEQLRDPEDGGGLRMDEFSAYAKFQARTLGFSAALDSWEHRESDFWSRYFAYTVGLDWLSLGQADPLELIARAALGPGEKTAAALGVLAAQEIDAVGGSALRTLDRRAIELAARRIAQALAPRSAHPSVGLQQDINEEASQHKPSWVVEAVGNATENLCAARFSDAPRHLLAVWSPPPPRHQLPADLDRYLRWAALHEALTDVAFDPSKYGPSPEDSPAGHERNTQLEAIRREMARRYPPLRIRALAWIGAFANDLTTEIRSQIGSWNRGSVYWAEWSTLTYEKNAVNLLETILTHPESHVPLAREVIEVTKAVLAESGVLAPVACIDVLSRDERYLGEADRLVRETLDRCRSPEVTAGQGMQKLLQLYKPAARIGANLARRVIVAGRDIAGRIDSRIYARAEALSRIVELALPSLDAGELDEVCALMRYWWSVDVESAQGAAIRCLKFLAYKDPGAALQRAWDLDHRGLLEFEHGLGQVAAGALAARSVLPECVWPIIPILVDSDLLNRVALESIKGLSELGLPVRPALRAYCRLMRLGATGYRSVEETAQIVESLRSAGLGFCPETQELQAFAERLEAVLSERKVARSLGDEISLHQPEPTSMFDSLSDQIPQAPRTALSLIKDASGEELKLVRLAEFQQLISFFLEYLPLSDRPALASVIERWGAMNAHSGAEALSLLDSLLGDRGNEEPELVEQVDQSLRRLLTADTLNSLTYLYRRDGSTVILEGRWAPPSERLGAILEAAAKNLRQLGSDTLFALAGHAAALLNPQELDIAARGFLARTVAEAPDLGDPAVPGGDPRRVIPSAIKLALGHPRQELRWRGVYAVVHSLVDHDRPESFLEQFLEAFETTDEPRWLSVREWLAFALEHVALRNPAILRDAVNQLLPHALTRELPHAKIRHHLQQVLLAVEKSIPGSLSAEDLASVKRVNRPTAIVQGRSMRSTFSWQDIEGRDRVPPFQSKTLQYRYEPLSWCFAGDEVQRMVVQKATDWMARIGVTCNAVEAERLGVGKGYRWQDTLNLSGDQPKVELLHHYGERHGLFLAAGELIDSTPVLDFDLTDGGGNCWDHWARGDLRGADPALPARLIDVPPPLADNYGSFSSPVDVWRQKAEPAAFLRELEVPGEPDWIVVAGARRGFQFERSFSSWVDSALVSAATASALVRLLETGSRGAFLPRKEFDCSSILPELEAEVETDKALWREPSAGEGRFVLKAWAAWLNQEALLQDLDPCWPGTVRTYVLPALDVVLRLGLTRHPAELLWTDETGRCVARCDLWCRSESTGERSFEGCRLVMRRDLVSAYAREFGLDVIFAVHLRRHGRSRSRGSGSDEVDPGTIRCYLWSDLADR